MSEDIRKFAQQHVNALAEPINDLVGRVIAKGLTGILEECCVLQRRVMELEAQLAGRSAQEAKLLEAAKAFAHAHMECDEMEARDEFRIDLGPELEFDREYQAKTAAYNTTKAALLSAYRAALSAQANEGEKAE